MKRCNTHSRVGGEGELWETERLNGVAAAWGAMLTPDPHEDGKEHGPLVVKQMGLLEESAGQQVREGRERCPPPSPRYTAGGVTCCVLSKTHLTRF